ncbi:MAG: hydantoinase/carbamoylase family amidase [Paracoccaceae bacterium]
MPFDAARFLADLHALRAIGQRSTGVVRPAFAPAEIEARLWSVERMREAGLSVSIDPAGNVFGLPEGDGPFLLMGSHTDSQPEGGWLDGALGVVAALEAARALPGRVAVVNFQDEEGRFGALTGSSVWSGATTLEAADATADAGGLTFREARQAMGEHLGADFVAPERFKGFVELHIEQGPRLIEAGEALAVVEAIVGAYQVSLAFEGEQNHAGTTPMNRRRDAFRGLAAFATGLDALLAPLVTETTVWTIGQVSVQPGAPSIVPGRATASVQWRDVDAERLDAIEAVVRESAERVAKGHGLDLVVTPHRAIPPRRFDPGLCEALDAAAEAVAPDRWRRLASGAMHDAMNVARLMPAAMLFVPSIGGVSHSFAEDTDEADLVAGGRAMVEAAERLA